MLKKLGAVFDYIISGMAAFGGGIIVFCMIIVAANITMRYMWNISQSWLMQFIEYSLLFMTFLGIAWVMRSEGHVKMDLLLNRLGIRPRSIVVAVTSALNAIIFLIVALYSAEVTWDFFLRGYFDYKVINVPKAYVLFIIPLGSFILAIELIRRTIKHLGIWRNSKKLKQES